MGFTDRFSRNKKRSLPRGARVVRRERRSGGYDTGYYDDGSFYLIDTGALSGYNYYDSGSNLSPSDAREQLADCGYDASSYSPPSDSGSYDSGSNSCDPTPSYSDPSPTYSDPSPSYSDPSPSYSDPSPSYDSSPSSDW